MKKIIIKTIFSAIYMTIIILLNTCVFILINSHIYIWFVGWIEGATYLFLFDLIDEKL